MFDLLKRFPSHIHDYTPIALWSNVLGGLGIFVTFITVGILTLYVLHKHPTEPISANRVMATKFLGWFLIACGFSRGIDVLCLWYNLANLSGLAKCIVTLLATVVLLYIPVILKELIKHQILERVKQDLQKTKEDIERIKDLSEKLDKKNE